MSWTRAGLRTEQAQAEEDQAIIAHIEAKKAIMSALSAIVTEAEKAAVIALKGLKYMLWQVMAGPGQWE